MIFTADMGEALRNAQFVFEAVVEDLGVKQSLFESM